MEGQSGNHIKVFTKDVAAPLEEKKKIYEQIIQLNVDFDC